MTTARSLLLFALAAVAEIGGAWLVWQGLREHRGWLWVGAGMIALGLYGIVATLQPEAHFGRVLAAYGGVFVVEAAIPSAWLPSEAYTHPERVTATSVTLDVCTYDPVTQILDENHVRIGRDGIAMMPISLRLAWPSELDLMAQLAGFTLESREADWDATEFTADSRSHVSVYRLG